MKDSVFGGLLCVSGKSKIETTLKGESLKDQKMEFLLFIIDIMPH